MHAARMVEMRVGRDRRERLLEEIARRGREAGDAEPGIDQHVALAAADVPDVAAEEPMDMRLPEEGHAILDGLALEPAIGDRGGHEMMAPRVSLPRLRGRVRVGERAAASDIAKAAENLSFPHLDPPPQAGEEECGRGSKGIPAL